MSVPQHTPGPWFYSLTGLTIHTEAGIAIAEVFDRGTETPDPKANARLIAAAPEFYQANAEAMPELKAALKSLEGMPGTQGAQERISRAFLALERASLKLAMGVRS